MIIDNNLEAERYHLSYEWLERQLSHHFGNALLFPVKDTHYYGVLLQKAEPKIKSNLSLIHHQLKERLPIRLHFSIGNNVNEVTSIHFSYEEALKTYKTIAQTTSLEFVH